MRITYVIVFVSDMRRSVAFYRDQLGLPLKFESPKWTEFATGQATLALHLSQGERQGPSGSIEAPGTCRLGIGVPDLGAFHQAMVAAGVPCVEPPTRVAGVMVAQYADPDGQPFSVGEDRPG